MDLSCKNCTRNVLAAPAGKIIGVWTIYCFQPFNSQLHVQQRLLMINGARTRLKTCSLQNKSKLFIQSFIWRGRPFCQKEDLRLRTGLFIQHYSLPVNLTILKEQLSYEGRFLLGCVIFKKPR